MGEDLYELPEGWVWTSIKEISEVITGTTPSKSNAEYYGRDFPFFKPTDLNKGYYVREAHDCLSKEGIQKARLIPEKSILVTCIGATISKTGFIRVKGSCNQQINAIVPNINLLPEFVYFWCISPFFKKTVIAHASSTTLPILNKSKFETLSFPFPPLPEQYRIVAKIEEIFTELDAGVELLKKLKVKLKRYRQAVLKSAVEGSLTQEWRTANQDKLEPASILLERILKQRREKWEAEQLAKMKAQGKTPKDDSWKLKYKEPVAPDTSDLPKLPDGWVWVSLDTVLSDIKSGKSFKCENEKPPSPEEVGVIKVSAVTWGEFNELKSKTCTEQSKINPELFVREGDFLFSRANTIELIGACVIAKKVNLKVMLSDKILRFYFVELSSKWILFTLRSRQGRNDIERLSTGNQESMRNIGQDRIRCIRIPIAPMQEMEQIINEVERCLSVIDQLEKTIDSNLKRAEKLRQSILKQAFEGKLVPQDPNDEPAEKLLERIKAEKAKQTTTKTPRKTKSKKKSDLQLEIPLK
jgi:Restriction endonuclease S subunits